MGSPARRALAGSLLLLALLPVSASAATPLRATIKRTAYGIPHIAGQELREPRLRLRLRASPQDNICTIADTYVTVRAERSRFFGPDELATVPRQRHDGQQPQLGLLLPADHRRQDGREAAATSRRRTARVPEIAQGVRGYVAGYNRYLQGHAASTSIPDPTCRGQDVGAADHRDRRLPPLLPARPAGQPAASRSTGSAGASRPTPALPARGSPASPSSADASEGLDERFRLGGARLQRVRPRQRGDRERPRHGARQPALPVARAPSASTSRTSPSPARSTSRARACFGVPIVLIGHTQQAGLEPHRLDRAFRFTPFQLTLVPGSPTTYLYDGEAAQMTRRRGHGQGRRGRRQARRPRRARSTRPSTARCFTSILGLPLFPWTPTTAYAMGDANASNFRYLNHFFEINQRAERRASSTRSSSAVPGHPVGQHDRRRLDGQGLYADIGVDPERRRTRRPQPATPALGTSRPGAARAAGARRLARRRATGTATRTPSQPGIFGPSQPAVTCSATTT